MQPSILTLTDITFTYPDAPEPLFDNVDVSFPRGWTAVVGDNGIGKSTLMAIARGVLIPDKAPSRPIRNVSSSGIARNASTSRRNISTRSPPIGHRKRSPYATRSAWTTTGRTVTTRCPAANASACSSPARSPHAPTC
ncbi:hypothetical protein [Bifidobacterium stellenboschense]|uniref:hypothetical protein n=1 Tax=Bifidobacterium stellenboschense TaxID=762211 RepID=UPI00138DF2C4|nr:hypothetical protein [Bifidobacterium stellenboschense]